MDKSQKFITQKFSTQEKVVDFVFHGGSGSAASEISEAISYGVIKMNIDTDTQWATWAGVKGYYEKYNKSARLDLQRCSYINIVFKR